MVPVVGLCAVSFLPVSVAAGEYYSIINASSGLCLDATATRDDAFVQQSGCQNSLDGQKWQKVSKEPRSFKLQNKWTGMCLDVYAPENLEYPWLNTVTTSECDQRKKNQKWEDIGRMRIRNDHTGQCLAAPGKLELGTVKVVNCGKDDLFLKWSKK